MPGSMVNLMTNILKYEVLETKVPLPESGFNGYINYKRNSPLLTCLAIRIFPETGTPPIITGKNTGFTGLAFMERLEQEP